MGDYTVRIEAGGQVRYYHTTLLDDALFLAGALAESGYKFADKCPVFPQGTVSIWSGMKSWNGEKMA